jgi:hypothetical protein
MHTAGLYHLQVPAAACRLDMLWILLLLPLSVVAVRYYAIAREECYLEKIFCQ